MPGIPWCSIDALHVCGPVGSCPRDPCREHHHAIIFSAVVWLLAETKAPHAPPRPRKPSFPSRRANCRAVVFSGLEEKGRQARERPGALQGLGYLKRSYLASSAIDRAPRKGARTVADAPSHTLDDEPDPGFAVSGHSPPEVALGFISRLGEPAYHAVDGIDRFVTRWRGVGYGSAVDHIVVGEKWDTKLPVEEK
jgi:hypothetical protein